MTKEKTVVNITSEVDRMLIVETADGKSETYYLNPIRTMHLQVEQLRVVQNAHVYDWNETSLGTSAELSLCVQGTATMQGRSISIIGDPESATRTFEIGFRALNEKGRAERDACAKEKGIAPRYTGLLLGFNRHDWEIGNDDSWFIDCEVLPSTLEAIAQAVKTGTMHQMSVGLTLRRIYTDDDWAPPSVRTDWFLRPNRQDNSIDSPELANGDISRLNLTLAEIDMRPKSETAPEPESESENDTPPPPLPPNLTAMELNALARNVEKLHGTLKVVGWLIACALIYLAIK